MPKVRQKTNDRWKLRFSEKGACGDGEKKIKQIKKIKYSTGSKLQTHAESANGTTTTTLTRQEKQSHRGNHNKKWTQNDKQNGKVWARTSTHNTHTHTHTHQKARANAIIFANHLPGGSGHYEVGKILNHAKIRIFGSFSARGDHFPTCTRYHVGAQKIQSG